MGFMMDKYYIVMAITNHQEFWTVQGIFSEKKDLDNKIKQLEKQGHIDQQTISSQYLPMEAIIDMAIDSRMEFISSTLKKLGAKLAGA